MLRWAEPVSVRCKLRSGECLRPVVARKHHRRVSAPRAVHHLADLADAATKFEPRIDPNVVVAQVTVLGATASAGLYWWLVVVPSARARLIRAKQEGGDVATYLEELRQDPSRTTERWFYAKWLQKREKRLKARDSSLGSTATTSGESTGVNAGAAGPAPAQQSTTRPRGRGSSANLFEPEYRIGSVNFFSLDNPILVVMLTLAGLAAGSQLLSFFMQA